MQKENTVFEAIPNYGALTAGTVHLQKWLAGKG
jgi:hypothetical protein